MTPACCQSVDVLLMSNCVAKSWSNLEFMEGLIWKRKLFKQRCWLANGLSPSFKLFQHVSGELAECTLLLKPQSPQRPGAKLPKVSGSDSQWALRVWGRFGSQQRPGQKGAGGVPAAPPGTREPAVGCWRLAALSRCRPRVVAIPSCSFSPR